MCIDDGVINARNNLERHQSENDDDALDNHGMDYRMVVHKSSDTIPLSIEQQETGIVVGKKAYML